MKSIGTQVFLPTTLIMHTFKVTAFLQRELTDKAGDFKKKSALVATSADNQPLRVSLSWTFSSSSSLMNCAFEESKSKSVSNLRVGDGALATISWPLLRFLRRRGPKIIIYFLLSAPQVCFVYKDVLSDFQVYWKLVFNTLSFSSRWPGFSILLLTVLRSGSTWV